MADKVLIIDLGGSFTQKIARKVREKKVYSEIVPVATPVSDIVKRGAKGIIVTGGSGDVSKKVLRLFSPELLKLSTPILFIGKALKALFPDYESIVENDTYFKSKPDKYVFFSLQNNGEQDTVAGESKNHLATLRYPGEDGSDESLIDYFLFELSKIKPEWTSKQFIKDTVNYLKKSLPDNAKAVCGLSGGIDSVVSAILVNMAINNRLTCIFVDHGLMRHNEPRQVIDTFGDIFKLKLLSVNAADEFLYLLKGVSDPEKKRHIIGETFIRVFEREAKKIKDVNYLVQGTIYPDIIESIAPSGEVIKSHHNVGGLPERMELKLIEPVKELFKDEVRSVAVELGLPDEIVWRQPFPGPGLAVRILGEITPEKIIISQKANYILDEEVYRSGLQKDIWQYFAVLPDIKSVGVSGDRRTYAYPVIIRAVNSIDAMTAQWYRFPHEILDKISRRIVEEIPEVNRVVYDITSKPPATIEWE